MLNPINLQGYFDEIEKRRASIKALRASLESASEELGEYESSATKEVKQSLAALGTTGDAFIDKNFGAFGLDKKKLENSSAFNRRLIESKGKMLALVFGYNKRICFRGDEVRDSDLHSGYAYVLGILSGEPLAFSIGENLRLSHIIMPFTQSVVWRDVTNKEDIVKGFSVGPKPLELAHAGSMGDGMKTFVLKPAIEDGSILCENLLHRFCFIGDEVENAKPVDRRCWGMSTLLDEVIKVLNAPTPVEAATGAGI